MLIFATSFYYKKYDILPKKTIELYQKDRKSYINTLKLAKNIYL